MMKLVVGLGNPGPEYLRSRHNAGFRAVETVAESLGFPEFKSEKLSQGLVSRKGDTWLLKPQQYMNRSGEAVAALSHYYRITPNNILIAHDDLDLRLGAWKFDFAKGPKIHNGVSSVMEAVGTETYRLRLGVDSRAKKPFEGSGAEYVLLPMTPDELDSLTSAIDESLSKIKEWLAE